MSVLSAVPRHIAIIPDGNRRWAKKNNVAVLTGHQKGAAVISDILYRAADQGVQYISLWGLSIDNFLKRTPQELMWLLRVFQDKFVELLNDSDIHRLQVRVRVLGQWREKFPAEVVKVIEAVEAKTKDYSGYNLTIFLAYNGTEEMRQAIQAVADTARSEAIVVTPEVVKAHLLTVDLPPVDLLIRTGGEPHLSAGFMMWDMADAELFFTETLWPDFSPQLFDEAVIYYTGRDRRRGK